MAKRTPAPAPAAWEPPPYKKRSSYSPEQSDRDANCQFWERDAFRPEQPQPKVSPALPARSWGSGSYDAKGGRPLTERGAPYGGQKASAGQHTTGGPGKASRPGRW